MDSAKSQISWCNLLEVIRNKSGIEIDNWASYPCSHILIPKGTKYKVLEIGCINNIAEVHLEEI